MSQSMGLVTSKDTEWENIGKILEVDFENIGKILVVDFEKKKLIAVFPLFSETVFFQNWASRLFLQYHALPLCKDL